MDKLKSVLKRIARFMGFEKQTKYVSNHIAEADIRSGVYMAMVIIIIEVWMICRQLDKYLIPGWAAYAQDPNSPGAIEPGVKGFLSQTSLFFLFLFVGLSIFVFCLTYKRQRVSPKTKLILNLVFAGITFAYGWYVFGENYSAYDTERHIINNVLTIVLYILALLLALAVIIESLCVFLNKKSYLLRTMIIVILFAAMCFAFGVKVSYSDYTSTNHKEIICFLTMVIYGACLIVWRPWISILLNTALFVGFYFLIVDAKVVVPEVAFKDGDLVNYITFLISLTLVTISIYHQRLNEAMQEEELDYLANYDELTELNSFPRFAREAQAIVNAEGYLEGTYSLLFINVVNFKAYNDRRGFASGNVFLKRIAECIKSIFPEELSCRLSDDHFMALAYPEGLEDKIRNLNVKVKALDEDLKLEIRAGGYFIHPNEDLRSASDKPRYACSLIHTDPNRTYLLYDKAMHREFHLMQYIIQHIDEAVKQGHIKPYYQPVCWSKDEKLCGVEALARWEDPERGLLPPGAFVPYLENTKLIHKLDAAIIVAVCRDIRKCLDEGLPVVPVSINFSRLDFELMDAVKVLEDAVAEYKVPKEYLHVEITESALSDNVGLLVKAVEDLKTAGYALWLDDFGSGYSSLNVLKDFDFDVMKIDLVFLRGFETNPKVQPLLESIIDMAKRLGMRTLAEGVETQEQRKFLAGAGCERLQGYLYGKPVPFAELQERIKKGELVVSKNLFD